MKNILFILMFVVLSLVGCAQQTSQNNDFIQNGKLSDMGIASTRLSVGLAFEAKPSAVVPAYAVSTAILQIMDGASGQSVPVSFIDEAIAQESAKLNLDPMTLQSFNDLVLLIKAKIESELNLSGLDATKQLVIVRQVVEIVQSSAKVRMVKV